MSSQMTSIEFATLFPATSQLTMLSAWVPAGAVVIPKQSVSTRAASRDERCATLWTSLISLHRLRLAGDARRRARRSRATPRHVDRRRRLPDDRAGVILALPPADGRDPPLDE